MKTKPLTQKLVLFWKQLTVFQLFFSKMESRGVVVVFKKVFEKFVECSELSNNYDIEN